MAAANAPQSTLIDVKTSTPYMRETARKWIAYSLMGLLVAIAVATLTARIVGQIDDDALKSIVTGLLAPVVGLVGAVTGFYFGGNQN